VYRSSPTDGHLGYMAEETFLTWIKAGITTSSSQNSCTEMFGIVATVPIIYLAATLAQPYLG
jgi:hypothetical protein